MSQIVQLSPQPTRNLSSIDDILADFAQGKMVILVDDENRENEGDLIVPAQLCRADDINFMATYGRGLICLAMDQTLIDQLQLPQMVSRNTESHSTAFTVSIDAKNGITTGISAFDRAKTITDAVAVDASPNDLVTPGHIFPLVARSNGVLERLGHTEAAVDLAKLCNLRPAGVICEIMMDNGEMARLPDLLEFGERHDIKIGTIADLVEYRKREQI